MTKFKEKQMVNFDTLLEEEATLSHEIELIADKIDTYDTAVEAHEAPAVHKGRPFRGASLRPQDIGDANYSLEDENEENVNNNFDGGNRPQKRSGSGQDPAKKFKEQIERINLDIDRLGGLTMGWDNEDHQIFLKVRTKHKNNVDKIAFVNDCMTSLPFMGEFDITEHIEKFKKHMELEEMKKKITKEYRENKENEKKNMVEMIRQEDLKKEELAKQRVNQSKTKEEKEKTKEKLKEWKALKAAKQIVEEEKVKEIEVVKKKEVEVVDKVKKEAVQKRLQEYKEKKELDRIREKEREEYKKALQQRRLDKEELDRLKEKEDNLLKKNAELIAMKKRKEQEKIERMQKSNRKQ